ncbi:MAG: hypothetical protein WC254_07305 [Candidatus Woesearchaeota archaeon]|jgi:uncharacterized protein YjbJ (UPF0337 family)
MKNLNIIGQRVKGQLQQVKGTIEDASGQHLKGKVDKLRGKTNVFIADIRNNLSK